MRIGEIDLLRFLAASSVVLYHLSFRGYSSGDSLLGYSILMPYSIYGYLGVLLFFMISGFVILMTAEVSNIRSFIISRFVRLYPAFWSSCTITFIVIILIGAPHFHATISQFLVNMTMLGGFLNVAPIDGVYWTLFIEMRFYALILIVIALKQVRNSEHLLVVWLAISILLEIVKIQTLRSWIISDYSAYFISGATF